MVLSTTAAGTINQTALGFCSLFAKSCERRGSYCLFLYQLVHCFWRHVKDDALVASFEKPPHHVCSHSSQANHPELHK